MAKTDGICKNKLMFYMYIGVRNAWNTNVYNAGQN